MAQIGQYNTLPVVKLLDFGAYLDGGELGEILLPIKQVPEGTIIGNELEVFIYTDSEDRVICTCEKPFATVGEYAYLKAVDVNRFGAFLDWGLVKNLMVPYSEQKQRMDVGKFYTVYVYLDEKTNRVVATAKIEGILNAGSDNYTADQEVNLLIYKKTEFGYSAIINNNTLGILYHNEIFQTLQSGQKTTGYVKKVRDDGKIDLSLQKTGMAQIDDVSQLILNKLKDNNGFLALNDKSNPDEIYGQLAISKKNFKKAVGSLYKQKLITIEQNGIRLKNGKE